MKLVAGNSNLALAEKISEYVKVPLVACEVKRFADKEIYVELTPPPHRTVHIWSSDYPLRRLL